MLTPGALLVVAGIFGLLISSCTCKGAPRCPQTPPGQLASYSGCCNSHLGITCNPEEGTLCLAWDPKRPHEGRCACSPGSGFHFPMITDVYKRTERPTKVEIETDEDIRVWRSRSTKRCTRFAHWNAPCHKLPPPVPDYYYPPRYYLYTEEEIPSSEFQLFENTGCNEYVTGMTCQKNDDLNKYLCDCEVDMVDPDPNPDDDLIQFENGECVSRKLKFAGQECEAGFVRNCYPDKLLTCVDKICVCKDPMKEYFLGIGTEEWGVKCAVPIRHNDACNPDNHVSGWCSWRQELTCDKTTRKCKCDDDSRIWLPSESKCLLREDKPCSKHDECATRFCYKNKCQRQIEQSQPCPSGLNEQCSSGFCHPKKKTCQYKTIEDDKDKKSNEVRLEPKIVLLLLSAIVSYFYLLWSM